MQTRKRVCDGLALAFALHGFLAVCAAPARAADVEIHYAPAENLERVDFDLLRSAHSKIDRIESQTSFLGLPKEDENIYQNEMPFDKEGQILLFTDGVIEAKGHDGEDYGDERLEEFIRTNNALQAELFNEKLLHEIKSFTGNTLKDDVFVLNIKTK